MVKGSLVPGSPWADIPTRIHVDDSMAAETLGMAVRSHLLTILPPEKPREPVYLCIGTDRSTGDALGPLVGSKLVTMGVPQRRVFGTLDSPVHAANLSLALQSLRSAFPTPFIIAVDACLGRAESVGLIAVGRGPLKPGTGVNKTLPPVGDIHITGIVNVAGYMEYLVLQNTRLSLVIRMADIIVGGIVQAMKGISLLQPPS